MHLVASSVEGLDPTQVTVAGADGKILSTGGGAAVGTGGDSGTEAQTVAFQNRMNASLQKMLDSLVGPGHAVVTTTADAGLRPDRDDQQDVQRRPVRAGAVGEQQPRGLQRHRQLRRRRARPGQHPGPGCNGSSSSTGTGQYENSQNVRNNALNEIAGGAPERAGQHQAAERRRPAGQHHGRHGRPGPGAAAGQRGGRHRRHPRRHHRGQRHAVRHQRRPRRPRTPSTAAAAAEKSAKQIVADQDRRARRRGPGPALPRLAGQPPGQEAPGRSPPRSASTSRTCRPPWSSSASPS